MKDADQEYLKSLAQREKEKEATRNVWDKVYKEKMTVEQKTSLSFRAVIMVWRACRTLKAKVATKRGQKTMFIVARLVNKFLTKRRQKNNLMSLEKMVMGKINN
jgi:hypothetical protein